MLTWEFSVLDFIQTHLRSGIGDVIMPFITHLGMAAQFGSSWRWRTASPACPAVQRPLSWASMSRF